MPQSGVTGITKIKHHIQLLFRILIFSQASDLWYNTLSQCWAIMGSHTPRSPQDHTNKQLAFQGFCVAKFGHSGC